MDPDRLLRACIVVVLGDGGRWVNFEDMVGRARALVEAVDKACTPARPDPLPLLCQAYQAMNAHARDMLRVHGCHESAGQLRDAADAIAAAYPEVMNDD